MPNWVSPKVSLPTKSPGIIVIESDDGNEGDHSRWFPFFRELSQKYSQFYPYNLVKGTLNVNTGTIGDNTGERRKMTVDNLLELQQYGWEISSHGRHHVGLGAQNISTSVSAGATTIKIPRAVQIIEHQGKNHIGLYSWKISEGGTSEVLNVIGGSVSLGEIQIATPLVNSYTTAAKVELTEESASQVLDGCKQDLASWGIDCESHAFTWHSGSYIDVNPNALRWISERFTSGRGDFGILNPSSYDARKLNSYHDNITKTQVNDLLTQTQQNNHVFIIYGHGDHALYKLDIIEHVAREGIKRGMRFMTRKELMQHLRA
ncbi:hypothetical protein M3936_03650 [Sutcliffiella horikoshii]|uniref:hypothetical protein n=1 Tax=Sutcliffiella horikoshii TaxID=79883 RepID=UPI00203F1D52|nr:hypothetical protein [Sutcliffiella horikoshii]MCM3616671.1 hypothetical protein [Sutcliffiella horikoshii]